MAIQDTDIATYLSGGAANADPNASIGGAKSSTAWTGGTLHDLWDRITGTEDSAEDVEYRCVYYQNDHATLSTVEQIFGIGTARCSETAIWEDVLMNDGHKNAFGAGLIDVVERL